MTNTQFHTLLARLDRAEERFAERFDNFEDGFGTRLRRVEWLLALILGGLIVFEVGLQTGVVKLG